MKRLIVIGAGPAGVMAAHFAAQQGIDCLILEKGLPFKDKACGDAVMRHAVHMIKELGIEEYQLEAIGGKRFCKFNFIVNGISQFNMEYTNEMQGWIIPRSKFDQLLRDKIEHLEHCKIKYQRTVKSITYHEYLWKVSVNFSSHREVYYADAIIDASGSSSLFNRDYGIDGDPDNGIGMSTYVHDLPEDVVPFFEFDTSKAPGYGWVFPSGNNTANIGYCYIGIQKSLRETLLGYVGKYSAESNLKIRGGAGSLWSDRGQIWHNDKGIISCGDSAGLIDPMTGEGITSALISGRLAGKYISHYLNSGKDINHLKTYSDTIRLTFGDLYRKSAERTSWEALLGLTASD